MMNLRVPYWLGLRMFVPIAGVWNVSLCQGIECDAGQKFHRPCLDFRRFECIAVGKYRNFVVWMWPRRLLVVVVVGCGVDCR